MKGKGKEGMERRKTGTQKMGGNNVANKENVKDFIFFPVFHCYLVYSHIFPSNLFKMAHLLHIKTQPHTNSVTGELI